jgi:hypothetical protein
MKKGSSSKFMYFPILFFILLIIFLVIIYLFFNNNNKNITINNNIRNEQRENPDYLDFNDPLLNPYAPPLRDERYLIPGFNGFPPRSVPINISTNIGAIDTTYRQLGILTPSSKDNILPLMGRPLFTNRDKWQYYSTSNQHNNVKLPISRAGKSCTNEYGCDKIYTGDSIYIEGVNETYRATIYDNNSIKYLPFI